MRVVFDTNTVISALLFKGKLTVLVNHLFLELALVGNADILVTGDLDLLELNKQMPFDIIMPIEYLNKYF